jgi:gliding motility-associated-like protein
MVKATFRVKILFIGFFFTFFLKGGLGIFAQTTQTFNYSGANQTFVVPCGVYSATVQAWGGGGGGGGSDGSGTVASGGGGGGYATSVIALTPGTSLTVLVGGGGGAGVGCQTGSGGGIGGYGLGTGGNGGNAGPSGCSGPGGGGGGGTGIMNGATILIVAGGGGGAGGGETNTTVAGAGGAAGSNGVNGNSCAAGILGASASTSGVSSSGPGVDDPGSGGGGGGLVGGGAGATPTGADNATGGSGGAGGTSQGNTITYGAGTTPGNSGTLGGICGGCSIGGGVSTAGGNGILTITYVNPPPLVSSITNGTTTCSFATATVSVSGGTPGYTYTWSPSGGNSAASNNLTTSGTYTAAYTDAGGCTGTATTNITVLSTVLTGTVTDGPGSCGVANATVTPSGGTAAYTYTWSPSGGNSATATNLSAGGYTVAFTDANGCAGTATTNIVVPPGLNMSLTGPVNPYCDTTKLDWVTWSSVTATSGVGSVSSNLSISLTKPSGGLFTTPSLFASGNFPPQYNLPANNTTLGNTQAGLFTFCFSKPVIDPQVAFSSIGQSGITVPIVTSVPYTIIWPGINMSYPNNTTLVGTEGYTIIQFPGQHTCIDFNYLTSENYCNLVFGIRDTNCQTTPICKGSAATFTASGGVSYTWSPNVALSATTGSIVTMNPTSYQTYTVIGTDINGCHDTAITSITVNSLPVPTVSSFTNVSCFGGNNGAVLVNVTNGLAPYHYLWTNGNTSIKDSVLIAGTYSVTVTDTNGCKGSTSQLITQPTVLKDSISAFTNLSCFGIPNGSATVGVTGGTGPYTYLWNSAPVQLTAIASNLFAGSYTVTVNDAHLCATTATVTLTQPPALTLTATQTSVTCNGLSNGSATATATGGTAPYMYAWSPAPPQISATGIATGLAAGQHTAGVQDAKGCQDTVSIVITQPTLLVASITSSINDSCFGDSKGNAVTGAVGGTGSYTYQWNTTPAQSTATANNLPAGTYTATATDAHGCQDTAVVTITQPTPLVATIASFKNDSCFGTSNGSATVVLTGGTAPRRNKWLTNPVQVWLTAVNLPAGTYTVFAIDSLGCTTTNTVTISQPPALTLTAVPTNVTCNGLSTGSATATAAGGTLPYMYAWNTAPPQISATGYATGLAAGQYTAGVQDANGCQDTVSITIIEPPILVATITSSKNDSCFGNSNGNAIANVTGGTGSYTYSWNTTPVQLTSTANNLPAGTYTATITDTHACQDTAVITITQPTVLTASITSSKNDSCFGNSNGNAVATGNGGTAPYAYSWNTAPTQLNATASNLAAGTYTATITDIKGCITTTTVTITQPPIFAASIISFKNDSCFGTHNGSAIVGIVGGTGPYGCTWPGTTPIQLNDTAINLSAGNYTVIVTDAKACQATTTVNITQPPALTLTTTQINVTCNGLSTGSATATATGGTLPYIYALEQPVQISPTGIFTGLAAAQYTTGVIDANGCRDSVSVIITQPAILVDSLVSQKNDSCFGNSNGKAVTGVTGGTLPYTYSWNTTPIQTTSTASNLPAGTYTATATDAHGCQDTTVVTITQPAVLTASVASSKNDSCFGNSNGNAVATGNGGTRPYLFSWNTIPVQLDSTASNLPMGSYTATITDIKGCITTTTVAITQPPLLAVSSPAKTICISNTATLTANQVGGTGPYAYLWNATAGTQTDTVSPIITTVYSVQVNDIKGCTATNTVTVFVRDSLKFLAVSPGAEKCNGFSANINATGSGGDSLFTYTWNPGGLVGQNVTVSPSTTTIYTLTLTDACGTPAVKTNVTVIIDPLPQINFSSDKQNGCYPLCVQFANTTTISSTDAITYSWNDGKHTSFATNPSWCYNASGVFTVSLTATSSKGCISKTSIPNMITVYPHPKAKFYTAPDSPTILEPTIQFTDASYAPGSSMSGIFWQTFGDGTDSTSTLPNPIHTYRDTGTYCVTLIATNAFGCLDTTKECIYIKPYFTLYIPNAFSPNGDGENDIFTAVGDYVFDFDMRIFDRWGNLVYHTTQVNSGWNGLMKGAPAKEDVYVYVISATDYHNKSYSYKGTVTLLK